jgi:glyoxylase-like metal-dependent hydrolase (beta-lactamase superfamily II)
LNRLRRNPGSYIDYLEAERALFVGDHIGPEDNRVKYTHEGPAAWDNAIRKLK